MPELRPGAIERKVQLMTPEEADEADRAYWAALTPNERVAKLCELRELWMTEDERRLKRTFVLFEVE